MTNSQRQRDSAVMISSAMPSAKYSCSGSPLMLVNGRTAIDGLSGRARQNGGLAGNGRRRRRGGLLLLLHAANEADAFAWQGLDESLRLAGMAVEGGFLLGYAIGTNCVGSMVSHAGALAASTSSGAAVTVSALPPPAGANS